MYAHSTTGGAPFPVSPAGVNFMGSLLASLRTRIVRIMYRIRRAYFCYIWQMDIGEGVHLSGTAKLDKTYPRGVHVGPYTSIAFGATILTHDSVNQRWRDVFIGENCLIGARAMILPGVRIGRNCIVSPASVVMRDVPDGSVVAGNPARVVETNIRTGPYGVRAAAIVEKLPAKNP